MAASCWAHASQRGSMLQHTRSAGSVLTWARGKRVTRTRGLRPVHGAIGGPNEVIAALAVIGIDGDADTGADLDRFPVEVDGASQHVQNLAGQGKCVVPRDARQQCQKLI